MIYTIQSRRLFDGLETIYKLSLCNRSMQHVEEQSFLFPHKQIHKFIQRYIGAGVTFTKVIKLITAIEPYKTYNF